MIAELNSLRNFMVSIPMLLSWLEVIFLKVKQSRVLDFSLSVVCCKHYPFVFLTYTIFENVISEMLMTHLYKYTQRSPHMRSVIERHGLLVEHVCKFCASEGCTTIMYSPSQFLSLLGFKTKVVHFEEFKIHKYKAFWFVSISEQY